MERRRASTVSETVATVTLSQMVDMALNNPEVGVVRFNILQSLLHAILRTLGIDDVEAHYDVTPVTMTAELIEAATSPGDEIAPLATMLQHKSSVGLPVLHIVMPAPATCELVPAPGTPFHEMAEKVKKMEVRLEKLHRAPSNEELLADTGVNRAGEGAVSSMWQNMQLMRRMEANASGMQEVTRTSNLQFNNKSISNLILDMCIVWNFHYGKFCYEKPQKYAFAWEYCSNDDTDPNTNPKRPS